METQKKPTIRRRRRKRGTGRKYFTQVHEDAILKYVASEDVRERTELYRLYIGPVFNEMVDKIVFTYKFTTLPNIDYLRDECKIWLVTILDKYVDGLEISSDKDKVKTLLRNLYDEALSIT